MVERLSDKCPCDKCTKDRKCELSQEACEEYLKWEDDCIKKLAEYEIAEEEGKFLVLPCKVGDTVWVITHPFNVFDDFDFYEDAHDEIYESYVSSITLYENSNQYRIYAKETRQFIKAYFRECDFGKSIFLNREEAESALEEMKKSNADN